MVFDHLEMKKLNFGHFLRKKFQTGAKNRPWPGPRTGAPVRGPGIGPAPRQPCYSGRNLQVFDLKSNTTEKFSNVYSTSFAAGVDYAGSWISNGNMSIFGGENSEPCYQQCGPLDDPGVYWGDSCDNSIIEGTVIKGGGQWVGYANVFKWIIK